MHIKTHSNIDQFVAHISDIEKKQLPFATSRAINQTVKEIQNTLVEEVPNRFDVTRKWWLPRQPFGIKAEFSKKTDLRAAVFTNAYFAPLQEEGGIKTPAKGKTLAIPQETLPQKYRKNYPNRSGAKRALHENKDARKAFIMRAKGSDTLGIWRRKTKKRYPLELMFNFADKSQLEPKWNFLPTAELVAKFNFEKNFRTSLLDAISKMK